MNQRVLKVLSTVFLTAMLAAGVACAKSPNDSEISGQLQSRFSQDSGLQGKTLSVQTASGVVTISGSVDNEIQRDAAARIASTMPGVKQVVNNLQVGSPSTTPPVVALQTPAPIVDVPKSTGTLRVSRPGRKSEAPLAATTAPVTDSTPTQPIHVTPVSTTPPPPPAPKRVTVPSGTTLSVRLSEGLNSETATQGQSFRATLDSPLAVDGDVAIPAGYDVQGHVVSVKSAGKFAGKSELVLQLDRISAGGKHYDIQTSPYTKLGSSRGVNTAEKVGAGAGIGAIIGAIAGGGKGAAIGAAAGGGLGGGVQAVTKGQQIKLPAETVLSFQLSNSVTVTPIGERNAGRPKLDGPDSQPDNQTDPQPQP